MNHFTEQSMVRLLTFGMRSIYVKNIWLMFSDLFSDPHKTGQIELLARYQALAHNEMWWCPDLYLVADLFLIVAGKKLC